jgi:hypothetical protein
LNQAFAQLLNRSDQASQIKMAIVPQGDHEETAVAVKA